MGMFTKEEFQDITPELLNLRCISLHHHSLCGWSSASGRKTPHAFYLYDAHTTTSIRGETGVMAQGRDIYPRPLGCLKHGLPFASANLFVIDG